MAKTLTSFQDFSTGWASSTQSTSHSSWPTVSVWISPSCWCSFPKSAITMCYQLAGSNRALVPHSSRLGNSGTMLRMGSCPSYSRTSSGLFQLLEFASNSRIPGLGAVSFSSWPRRHRAISACAFVFMCYSISISSLSVKILVLYLIIFHFLFLGDRMC